MNLKRRIERLERHRDVEDSRGLTWPEFQHAVAALEERAGGSVAPESGAPRPPPPGPRPKNIDSLVRRLKRFLEAEVGRENAH